MDFSKAVSKIVFFILAGVLMAQVGGCSSDSSARNSGDEPSQFRQDTVQVSVATVSERTFSRSLRTTGTLEAKQKATLNALVGGMIAEIYVDISDQVRQGEPLMKIRQVDYRAALEQAEANVASANAAVKSARRELNRIQNLREAGSATAQAFDQASTRFDQAQASLLQAKAALSTARQDYEDTIIRAPFDGVITVRSFEPSEYVRSGDPVFEIMDLSELEAELQIPESYLGIITPDAEVELSFKAQFPPGKGKIIAINPKINTATRTFTVQLRVPNEDRLLPDGVFAVANFKLPAAENVPAVPREAIQKRGGRTFVWLIKNGSAYEQEVIEGVANENWVMVERGLDSGDRIAVDGTGALIDGYPVQAKNDASNS